MESKMIIWLFFFNINSWFRYLRPHGKNSLTESNWLIAISHPSKNIGATFNPWLQGSNRSSRCGPPHQGMLTVIGAGISRARPQFPTSFWECTQRSDLRRRTPWPWVFKPCDYRSTALPLLYANAGIQTRILHSWEDLWKGSAKWRHFG